MQFTEAVRSAFRRTGDFRGRSSRFEYWYFFLLNLMIQVSTVALDYAGTYPWFTTAAAIWSLVALVPNLSLFVRRLRDGGYSPWMSLFILAGPLGAVVLFVLLCQRSVAINAAPGFVEIPGTSPDSGRHWRQSTDDERADRAMERRGSAILLGLCLTATLLIVVGAASFAVTKASIRDSEAQASASRAAAAATSRAAAAASARASAEAERQAAADGEAKRLAKILQDSQQAQASQSAAASQTAAEVARASAAARDKLVSEGWSDGPDGVFYQWVPSDQVKCPPYQRCVQLKVTAPNGCPNGVSVQASEMTKGTVTGSASAYSPGFLAGQNALVTITTHDTNADNVSIKKMTCN